MMHKGNCAQCGVESFVCRDCNHCKDHCNCGHTLFDADELGLDPETDNNPKDESRHA